VLKHLEIKCNNNHVQFDKRLHGNIKYIQKQLHLLQSLDFVVYGLRLSDLNKETTSHFYFNRNSTIFAAAGHVPWALNT